MATARAIPPRPSNEPVRDYAPGTPERIDLLERVDEVADAGPIEAPNVVAGRRMPTGDTFPVRAPHDHDLHLADVHAAGTGELKAAVDAALEAKPGWAAASWEDRAAVFLRAADLLAGPWRDTLNAATMLGQSKTIHQAEIDAACELIDFLRFNVHFYAEMLGRQPDNARGVWNRLDYRPLEGFVLAITPFNFTAIAGNLPTAPALCGNTVVWKPSEKQALAAHHFMRLLEAAGLPDGVINLVHGDGARAAEVCLDHPALAGLHFTGSVEVLESLWGRIGANVGTYHSFPRVVGESGGKDFVVAHPSADPDALVTAMVRGAFEYQGQKCSAVSRAYLPRGLWRDGLRERLADETAALPMGDVADPSTLLGAVIDESAFARHAEVLADAAEDPDVEVLAGGGTDATDGWFVEPTVLVTDDPRHELMRRELFGPIVTVFVYDDDDWEDTLGLVDTTSPFGLTGAVFATDRGAIREATERLRHAAGNFYVNDKPTGSIVGQQPFGGARASGTNDKAGSPLNLQRWISVRSIKETMDPPTDWRYPHLG